MGSIATPSPQMIYIGTSGWAYKNWNGIVYPSPKPRGFRPLAYLADYFDTVEINTSFYGPPKPNTTKDWLDQVSANREFRFTAKLYRAFTHERNATQQDENDFKSGMDVLAGADRLGAVLLQFPWSFKNTDESRGYLLGLFERFRKYPLVLEVRHGSWNTEAVLASHTAHVFG